MSRRLRQGTAALVAACTTLASLEVLPKPWDAVAAVIVAVLGTRYVAPMRGRHVVGPLPPNDWSSQVYRHRTPDA